MRGFHRNEADEKESDNIPSTFHAGPEEETAEKKKYPADQNGCWTQ
jgi:hypothetical protein